MAALNTDCDTLPQESIYLIVYKQGRMITVVGLEKFTFLSYDTDNHFLYEKDWMIVGHNMHHCHALREKYLI